MFGMSKKNADMETTALEGVHFHAELSTQLIASQSEVYSDFKSIFASLADGIQTDIEVTLTLFKRKFHTYLLDKNIKVFSYLKESVNLNTNETIAVNKSRMMNNDLSRSVNHFLDSYLKDGKLQQLSDSQKVEFEKQLRVLGKEMADVMRDERDSLFPIYDRQGTDIKT